MSGLCKGAVVVFALAWGLALLVLLIGTFGWFGQEKDPLSAVFLVPLGLPWNLFLGGLSDSVRPWAAALAPAVNLLILRMICGWLSR